MGILDDAIREHLELKRQHGVPEEELLRQEEEALGPARRNVAPAEAEEGDGEPLLEAEGDGEPVLEEDYEASETEEPPTELEIPELDEPPGEAPFAEEPSEPQAVPFGVSEPDALDDQDEQEEEPPQVDEAPPAGYESLDDDELLEEEEEEEEEEAQQGGPGDVLEDTPDFLQETPEHDRLWFEQKPPRDFDFD
jgi:hypothetical protein